MMDDSNIPIDIHTNKLMDWLLSRRHVARDWQTKVYAVREKINEAIKDMPVHEGIAALLSGSYINFYHCLEIIKILEETESSSKNFLGQYGSQRMKDWKEIVRLYEKDNIYLGEVASLLLRNINYEVPAFRKQIQKLNQQAAECDKKEAEYEKQANNVKNEINGIFKELGIQGKNVRIELLKKALELPKLNVKVGTEIKSLKNAAEFYSNVVSALTGGTKEVLTILKFIIERGDVTVYEWRTGEAPVSIETSQLDFDSIEEKKDDEDAIDFEIDLELEGTGDEGIDWGISTDDAPISEDKVKVGIASGDDARTLLGHHETRILITNDVLELESFLKFRHHEISTDDGLALTSLPDALLAANEKKLADYLETTRNVLKLLNNATALHFLNINTNPSYVDRLTKSITDKLKNHEKLLASKNFVKSARADALKEVKTIEPKVKLIIDKTRILQEQIEMDISKRYNGRQVNLMGGVNIL